MTYRLHYAPDNASLIIRLALGELGVAYETVLVDRRARAQKSPAYLALNPAGLIPVLETSDGAVFETGAILLWLADRHGVLAPAPDDPARGTLLKWLFFLSNTLHPAMRMIFYPDQYAGADIDTQEAAVTAHPDLFSGASPTVIGLYLGPALRWLALYPAGETGWFDLGRWPVLQAMAQALETRASAVAAARAEGLGPAPFSAPMPADPPEGAAL